MSVHLWVMQDLHQRKLEATLAQEQQENIIAKEPDTIPKLSTELNDFITRMQQNLGMRVEYGTLDNLAEISIEKSAVIRTDYSTEIETLEYFFNNCTIPSTPIQLSKGEKILNVQSFIESHLSTIKNYSNNKYFLPYLERLQKLKMYLS